MTLMSLITHPKLARDSDDNKANLPRALSKFTRFHT